MALSDIEKRKKLGQVYKYLQLEPEGSYNVFNQDEKTTLNDFNNLVGILDDADELGLDEGMQEALAGIGQTLNQRIDNQELNLKGLRSFNQRILDQTGGVLDFIADVPYKIGRDLNKLGADFNVPEQGPNVGGKIKDFVFDKAGIGYGDVDERTLPTNFASRVGEYSADVVPYAFLFNRLIMNPANPFGKPLPTTAPLMNPKFGPTIPGSGPVSGMQTYKATPNNFDTILASMRRYPATRPIAAPLMEAGGATGYATGMALRDDIIEDEDASFVKRAFAETLPIAFNLFGGVIPETARAVGGGINRTLQRSLGTGDTGLIGRVVRGVTNAMQSEDKFFREFGKGFTGKSMESGFAEPDIVGAKQKFVGGVMGYLKNTSQNIALHLRSNSKLKGISNKTDEEIQALAEEYAYKQLERALLVGKENPKEVLKNIKASNERLAKLSAGEIDDEIGQLSFIASQRGDEFKSQSPTLMALTNYEAKNNEAFLKRFAEMQAQREANMNARIQNILGGQDVEFAGMTYAEAVRTALNEESNNITKTIDDFVSSSYNTLKNEFNLTDAEASTRTTQIIREIFKDVKANEKKLWKETESNFEQTTKIPFKNLEKAKNDAIVSNPADTLYNDKLKRPINTVINKLNDGESITYKEAYNLKKSIDLEINKEISKGPEINQAKLEELYSLRTALNSDIGEGYAFAKEASAITKGKHDAFTRNNTVFNIVNKTSRNTFQQEESQLAEILLEQGVAKYEKTPFGLNQIQEAIKDAVPLTGKEVAEQTKIIKESENSIQGMLALMVDDVFDPGTGTFNPNSITQWINQNQKIINQYPKFKELINKYKNNVGELTRLLNDNAFELNTVSKDPFTGEIKITSRPQTQEVNYFGQIINSENPSVVLERVLLDQENGASQLMNIINNTKKFPNKEQALKGLKSSIVEAISRMGFATSDETPGVLVSSRFSTLMNKPHGANKTLRETLEKTGLFTKQELDNLDTALKIYDQDLGALNNPDLFRALKEIDPTNGMIDTFVRVAAANFSTNFSTGAGAGLVIAGRFTKLATAMLQNLKNEQIKRIIEDALLDSKKMERLLTIGQNLNKGVSDLSTPKNKAEAYTKFRSYLLTYGVELTYPEFETAWEDMTFEEKINQSRLDALKYGVQ